MTLFVRHPVKNMGKMNSYEKRVSKYKEVKAGLKPKKSTRKASEKTNRAQAE